MELKVKKDTFYLLDTGDEKLIYDAESEVVKALKTFGLQRRAMDPEKVRIVEINIVGEKLETKSVPWSKIAIELAKE